MTSFLAEMSKAGLDLQLQGDDSRLSKYEAASKGVAERLKKKPAKYVGAILAGLDPDTPADDEALLLAREELLKSWPSVESIFPDAPRGIYRALLLDACGEAVSHEAAAIVWLTAADTLPMCRLGRQEDPVARLLLRVAERVEVNAVAVPAVPALAKVEIKVGVAPPKALDLAQVDRESLSRRVEAAVGPQNRGNKPPLTNPNPNWANSGATWCFDFADRMAPLLADQYDMLSSKNAKLCNAIGDSVVASQTALAKSVTEALANQQVWMQHAIASAKAEQDAEKLRVSALWWSEALYSPSLHRSYRELAPTLAAIVMALDLIGLTPKLSPASVGYLLAETVGRLPEAGFGIQRPLVEWLDVLRSSQALDLAQLGGLLCASPISGRVSVRDLVAATLRGAALDPALMGRLPGGPDTLMSLPNFAHALFRQEKALRLAGGKP